METNFSWFMNFLQSVIKVPSVVPAEPGRGVVIDINVTKDCADIESKMEKLFDPNDFTMKSSKKKC